MERLVRTDVQTPGYMRAPFEHPACFAMECCVDELAYAFGQDPLALRLANDTDTNVATGLPFLSRYVAECLSRGSELFGWTKRSMAPRSMRSSDGSAIGWGIAVGAYPGLTDAGGRAFEGRRGWLRGDQHRWHEMGQGIRTALANAVSRKLGVPAEKVRADKCRGKARTSRQALHVELLGRCALLPSRRR